MATAVAVVMIPTSFHEKHVKHSSLPYTVVIVSNHKTVRVCYWNKKGRDTTTAKNDKRQGYFSTLSRIASHHAAVTRCGLHDLRKQQSSRQQAIESSGPCQAKSLRLSHSLLNQVLMIVSVQSVCFGSRLVSMRPSTLPLSRRATLSHPAPITSWHIPAIILRLLAASCRPRTSDSMSTSFTLPSEPMA